MAVTLVSVSDVINELSIAKRDDDRTEFLRNLILVKSVMRDLRIQFLNRFKRVYLAIDKTTNTVRLPADYYKFQTISVIQKCLDRFGKMTEKVLPLTHNQYINITPVPEFAPDSCQAQKSCGCAIDSPVCQELANFQTICEEVVLDPNSDPPLTATKQTILKTCANGDIIKEVSQPTQKFIEGDLVCDYAMTIPEIQSETIDCIFQVELTLPSLAGEPVFIRYTLNGILTTSPNFSFDSDMISYMGGIGWTDVGSGVFEISDASHYAGAIIYEALVSDPDNGANIPITSDCDITVGQFPYTIDDYIINNETITSSPSIIISNQADQDAFFAGLGFTKVTDSNYTLTDSKDVYYNMTISYSNTDSPSETTTQTINFIQSNCHRPIINDGFENVVSTDVLCNIEVKPNCGCVVQSQANIDTIVSCCGPWLNCCQSGELTGWANWNYKPCCPTNTPQPYNLKGTYYLDEENLLIYLDSVGASQVLLSYYDDGSCDGELFIPDYCIEMLKAGVAWKSSQYDEDVSPIRRQELKINYQAEKTEMDTYYLNPLRINELVEALRTKITF